MTVAIHAALCVSCVRFTGGRSLGASVALLNAVRARLRRTTYNSVVVVLVGQKASPLGSARVRSPRLHRAVGRQPRRASRLLAEPREPAHGQKSKLCAQPPGIIVHPKRASERAS